LPFWIVAIVSTVVAFDRFLHVQAWLDRGLALPAVERGPQVTVV
jgi:GST-like protein